MAVSSVGMFGEGITHGTPVWSHHCPRDQPSMGTTSSCAPSPNCSLNSCASSAIVSPCRSAIGNSPTNDSYPGCSIGPSTVRPPIGFGRSHTMTGMPLRAPAFRQYAIVYTNVYTRVPTSCRSTTIASSPSSMASVGSRVSL